MSITNEKINSTNCEDIDENYFLQIESKALKIGYADGVNDGRESVFQQGFDRGYKDGLTAAFNLEKFKFFFNNLNAGHTNNPDLLKEKEEFMASPIKDLKSLQIENDKLSNASQEYVNKSMEKLTQKMPEAAILLNVQSCTGIM